MSEKLSDKENTPEIFSFGEEISDLEDIEERISNEEEFSEKISDAEDIPEEISELEHMSEKTQAMKHIKDEIIDTENVLNTNFFNLIGGIPSIDKISFNFVDNEEIAIEEEEDFIGDEGFVEELEDEQTLRTEDTSESGSLDLYKDDSDLGDPDQSEKKPKIEKREKKSEMKIPEDRLSKEKVSVEIIIENEEIIEEEEDHFALQENAMLLIDDLISKIVTNRESIQEDTKVESNKNALIAEILYKIDEINIEKALSNFLNQKCTEYFKRKKEFRCIEPLQEATMQDNGKFYKNLQTLDEVLALEQLCKDKFQSKISELQEEIKIKKQEAENLEEELEQLIKTTFLQSLLDKKGKETDEEAVVKKSETKTENRYQLMTNYYLRKMAELRSDISKIRYILLKHQHTITLLTEKSSKMEDLGDGLRLMDYEKLQADAGLTEKKIEERTAEVVKFQVQFRTQAHMLSHDREKINHLNNAVKKLEDIFNQLVFEKQSSREHLYKLQIYHNKLLSKIDELRRRGGLLCQPELLCDYDTTAKQVNEMHNRIVKLKKEGNYVDRKIMNMTKALDLSF